MTVPVLTVRRRWVPSVSVVPAARVVPVGAAERSPVTAVPVAVTADPRRMAVPVDSAATR